MFGLFQKSPAFRSEDINRWQELKTTPAILLVDVRTPQEFRQSGHLPGAANYPLEELASRYQQWFPHLDQPIGLYCLSGSRSRYAAKWLTKRGYTQIIDFGSVYDWQGTLQRF